MKSNRLTLVVIFMGCVLLLQAGCEEETMGRHDFDPDWFRQQTLAARMSRSGTPAPRIAFEKLSHHFGNLGPGAHPICEFKFTNIGNDVLVISEIEQTCGCTPYELKQTRYAPAESGVLRVQYYAESQLGSVLKKLYVYSNDWRNPKVPLTVKANIISKVSFEPQNLQLLLNRQNGGCPPIVLTSVDNRPFSITHFLSTGSCVTADFDPSAQSTRFVLQPRVDVNKLEEVLNGRIEIGLSHPECKQVTINLNAKPRFRVAPTTIVVRGAEANLPVAKKVKIFSNYNEPFTLESALSKQDIVKVLDYKRIRGGYELELEVTPPSSRGERVFSESFLLNLKGGRSLAIPCSGSYVTEGLQARAPVRRARGERTITGTGRLTATPTTTATTAQQKPEIGGEGEKECVGCGKLFQFEDFSR